jgi:hypothetical protein
MITGEQNIAALDRINANLKTTPSEPWLLAMKCELLLQLIKRFALLEMRGPRVPSSEPIEAVAATEPSQWIS